MEKEFISYEQALALKELGFDEPCLAFYNKESKLIITGITKLRYSPKLWTPTFSQAFRFFREKYGFINEVNVYSTSDGYSYSFKILCKKYTPYIEANNSWLTYEEAELECLKKLIEIVKTNEL